MATIETQPTPDGPTTVDPKTADQAIEVRFPEGVRLEDVSIAEIPPEEGGGLVVRAAIGADNNREPSIGTEGNRETIDEFFDTLRAISGDAWSRPGVLDAYIADRELETADEDAAVESAAVEEALRSATGERSQRRSEGGE